jgi:hypothetical protein
MRNFLSITVIGAVILLLTSTTTKSDYVTDNRHTNHQLVDITIAKYPPPLNFREKYHVTINGKAVGMLDEDTQALLDLFQVDSYTGQDFHDMNLGTTIWVRRNRQSAGFTTHLRTR